jgi:hypothetical protein
MVTASRRHLTERYASGVDRLLWDTEKRLVPDLDAIRSVIEGAASGEAEALDVIRYRKMAAAQYRDVSQPG